MSYLAVTVNDYLRKALAAGYQLPFSMAIWMKWPIYPASGFNYTFSMGNSATFASINSSFNMVTDPQAGFDRMGGSTVSSTGGADIANYSFADGSMNDIWFPIVVVFEGTGLVCSSRRVYTSLGAGAPVSNNATMLDPPVAAVCLFEAMNGSASTLTRYLAEPAIWNLALTQAQANEYINGTPADLIASARAGLLAYWSLAGGPEQTAGSDAVGALTVVGATFNGDHPPVGVTGPAISSVSAVSNTGPFTILGSGFGTLQGTVSIGGVAQTVTAWADGSVTCTAGIGTLKFGAYDLTLADTDLATAVYPVTFNPLTGHSYKDLSGTLAPAANRITATPTDLAAGNQLEFWVSAGSGNAEVFTDGSFAVDNTVTGLTARVNDGTGWGTTGAQTITIAASIPPTITTVALGTLQIGVAYSLQLAATGDIPFTWSRYSGTIPAGLTLDTTGLLHGTPTGSGAAYNFEVEATNASGADTQAYTGNVNELPAFTGSTVPLLRVGVPYSATVQHTGYPEPVFTVQAGSMPAGMVLSSAGLVSGTPTTAGAYSVTIRMTNAAGFVDRVASGQVEAALAAPVITTTTLSAMSVGIAFSQQLAATGNPAPAFAVQSGSFPAGLTMDSAGLITGTPTTAGAYSVTPRATNSGGFDDQLFTGTVSAALSVPVITTITLNAMYVGVAFSQQLFATGNPAPTWAVSTGPIVAGLSLSAAGLLSGTPTTAGAYGFTVTATNSQGSDPQVYAGSVSAAAAASALRITLV